MSYNYKVYNWYYTFYLSQNDEVYCSGTKQEVLEKLSIKENNFHSTISKIKVGKNKRFVVVVEDIEKGTMRVVGEKNADYQRKLLKEKEEFEDEIFALYEKGYSDVKIADELGCTAEKVRKFRYKCNLPKNTKSKREKCAALA